MSTGYGWEGLRQVCAMLLGVCYGPERPCSGLVYLGCYNKCSPLPFYLLLGPVSTWMGDHLRAGKPSPYVTSHLGQLSLPSLRGR